MFIMPLKHLMRRMKMTFNLNKFINFMDQVKDKDWVDNHVVINSVRPEFQKLIKDKIREKLTDEQLPTPESNEKRKV